MSTCISRHGEFGSHDLDDHYTCKLCAVLDEDALRTELDRLRGQHAELILLGIAHDKLLSERAALREERDALRVGLQEIIYDYGQRHRNGGTTIATTIVAARLGQLLDRTSTTGE